MNREVRKDQRKLCRLYEITNIIVSITGIYFFLQVTPKELYVTAYMANVFPS